MAVTKESLQERLLDLIKDLETDSGKIEGLAVADASRIANAIIGAYNAARSILESETPKLLEVSDPGFELIEKNTKAVAAGKAPNVHSLSGETVPPGSTEGVRPSGTVKADDGPVEDVVDGDEKSPVKAKPKGA